VSRRAFRLILATAALLACGVPRTFGDDPRVRVQRIIDGDTITLEDRRAVRYIGIDTPEARRKVDGRWVDDPEPFAKAATAANRRLVDGQLVRLEPDVQSHDRYGRLLAYVYVQDAQGQELMVNAELLRQGMAQLLTIPPNVKYVEYFKDAQREAREAKRGLWSDGKVGR